MATDTKKHVSAVVWRKADDAAGLKEGAENPVLLWLPKERYWLRRQMGYRLGEHWYLSETNGRVFPTHWHQLPEGPA